MQYNAILNEFKLFTGNILKFKLFFQKKFGDSK